MPRRELPDAESRKNPVSLVYNTWQHDGLHPDNQCFRDISVGRQSRSVLDTNEELLSWDR